MTSESQPDRRVAVDRRDKPTSLWDSFRGQGSRGNVRRACDRQAVHFIERFPARVLAWIFALLLLSIVDGLLTLELLDVDCQEVNPILEQFLDIGPRPFVIAKYLLIATGLPLLVAFSGSRRFRYLIPLFVALHVVLVTYQLALLSQLT